jgi:hypothetical protein
MLRLILKSFILILISLTGLSSSAQQKLSTIRAEASWIKMMDDPNVNYYEAIKAYNDYWKTHKKPADPEDRLLGKDGKKDNDADAVPLTKAEKIYEDEIVYQVKRFENWMREEKPFVQENGRILTQQERIEIWKKQQGGKAK